MDVMTTLIVTWDEAARTYTGQVNISDAWECGRLIGALYEYLHALHPNSMMQCIETLIPSNLAPPALRG